MATFPVKYITNTMRGAPQISGQAGTLQAALRAFLLTGFGLTTALSVTVAGGIATAALNEGQSFAQGCVILVDGGTPAQINGEARVLTSGNAAITWATTAPDGPATGTITIKVAPVGGWEELFPGTPNRSVFRSTDPQASGFCFRVDDSGTQYARVRGYEAMTDVDTGTGLFPTNAQINGGGYLAKSVYASSTAISYVLAADSRTVFIALEPYSSASPTFRTCIIRGFGDMIALAPGGDIYCASVSCSAGADMQAYGAFNNQLSAAYALYCPRPFGGIGGSQSVNSGAYCGRENAVSGNDGMLGAFPSPVDGELKYSRRYITNGASSYVPRASVPGVLHIPQSNVINTVNPGDTLQGTGDLAGRTLLALGAAPSADQAHMGISLLDLAGPWR